MKKLILVVLISLIMVSGAFADNIVNSILWTKPTTNTDGSAYTDPGGYNVKCGLVGQSYDKITTVGDVNTAPLVNSTAPDNGVYHCTVTTVNAQGYESDPQNEEVRVRLTDGVYYRIVPNPPSGFLLTK